MLKGYCQASVLSGFRLFVAVILCYEQCYVSAGSTQQHWPFPESHIGLGYAYILTHPGLPCVAWEHMWDPRHTFIITQLMALRKRQDIHAGSQLEIMCADRRLYVAKIDNRWVYCQLVFVHEQLPSKSFRPNSRTIRQHAYICVTRAFELVCLYSVKTCAAAKSVLTDQPAGLSEE